MPPIVEVTISPQGQITVQTRGFAGVSCQAASKFLEEALGVVTAERKTTEFYAPEPVKAQQHEGP